MTRHLASADISRFLEAYERISKTFSLVGSFPGGVQLGKPELVALEAIARQSGVTMSRLAGSLGIRLSTATGIVDRLAEKNVVQRIRNHGDRRIVRLSLTDQGQRIVSAHRKQMRAVIGKMLGMLSVAERRALLDIMQKVANAISGEAGGHR